MTTHNQILKAFTDFCTAHKQINSFYSGKNWNFQAKTNIYPAVIMMPIPSTVQTGKVVLSYTIFATDILKTDRSNLDEIYSDTFQIITDIISYFRDNDNFSFWIAEEVVNVEPFEDTDDDLLCGWSAVIPIEFPYTSNTCVIPK